MENLSDWHYSVKGLYLWLMKFSFAFFAPYLLPHLFSVTFIHMHQHDFKTVNSLIGDCDLDFSSS